MNESSFFILIIDMILIFFFFVIDFQNITLIFYFNKKRFRRNCYFNIFFVNK